MSATYEAYTRVWQGKDNLPREIQFLQPLSASDPQVARIMVGPRRILGVQDPSNQTLAISAALNASYNANTLVPGSMQQPPQGVGVLFELVRGYVLETDALGMIQIPGPLAIGMWANASVPLAWAGASLPFTMPKINNATFHIIALSPMPPYLPSDGPFTNGPQIQLYLVNTDASATHTYIRGVTMQYRYIYDMDYTKERVYVCGTLT